MQSGVEDRNPQPVAGEQVEVAARDSGDEPVDPQPGQVVGVRPCPKVAVTLRDSLALRHSDGMGWLQNLARIIVSWRAEDRSVPSAVL
jgi:hypothetical protein